MLSLALGLLAAQADIPLYAGKPATGWGVVASAQHAPVADALSVRWKDAKFASLRIEGGPVDLRPFAAQGVLAFDLNVKDMAQGGLSIRMDCGEQCMRRVPFLLPARAMEGKGWQRVVLPLSCFVREGDDFSRVSRPFTLEASGNGEVLVSNVRLQLAGTATASCPDYRTQSVTPAMLNESYSINSWIPRHLVKLAANKLLNAQGARSELVFIGDSIMHGWESKGKAVWERYYAKYNAVDLGFSGDRTENVLWRLQNGEVDGLSPKVVVLMIGTNNIGSRHEQPQRVAAGIQRIVDELRVRLPASKVLLLGIFPREEVPEAFTRRMARDVNQIVSGFADNKHVFYLDIGRAFLAPDGRLSRDIMPDFLHPNEEGYAIWAEAMASELSKLLSE